MVTAVVRCLMRLEAKERRGRLWEHPALRSSCPEAVANAVSRSGRAQLDCGGKVQSRRRLQLPAKGCERSHERAG